MSRLTSACLLVALLSGCASKRPAPAAAPENPFLQPAGSPRDVRVGFVQGYPPGSPTVPLLILPGTIVRPGLRLITRDPRLNPSAELEVVSLHGRIALARIVSGQPQPKDEAILTAPASESP